MIVKNEAKTIERCLRSVLPFVSAAAISDTGSNDATPSIILDTLTPTIPAYTEFHEWRNFGLNRNEALAMARGFGDWILTIDADEELIPVGPLELDPGVDAYEVKCVGAGSTYWLRRIFKNDGNWHYVGATHEVIVPKKPDPVVRRLEAFWYKDHTDGNRRATRRKIPEDIALLEQQVKLLPDDARTVFYLAQSYLAAGKRAKALASFDHRVLMGGWPEEVYYSLLQIAGIKHAQAGYIWNAVEAYLLAWAYRPQRYEAVNILLRELRAKEAWATIYSLGRMIPFGLNPEIPQPEQDVLFVEPCARWLAIEELGVAAWHLGKREEAGGLWTLVLGWADLPAEHRTRLEENMKWI